MKHVWKIFSPALLLMIVTACSTSESSELLPQVTALGRGINFGNMLEPPYEGAWGLTLREEFFDKAVEAGFGHIRLPIAWTHHAATTTPYTIDPVFFQRVDWAINQAKTRGLKIIINDHHHDELHADPLAEEARALAIWRQIAHRYRNQPQSVYFEILNEPHGVFNDNPQLWNNYLSKALAVIRQKNPTRKVIVGPVDWNGISGLSQLTLPSDPHLIATIHFYGPFSFTHQGAEWANPIPPVGRVWTGSTRELKDGWQNWSWSTSTRGTAQGIELIYQAAWAGFYLHSDIGAQGYTSLSFKTNKVMNLTIQCRNDNVGGSTQLTTQVGLNSIAMSQCNSPSRLKDLIFQNNTPNPQASFLIEALVLSGPNKTLSLIQSEKAAIRASLTRAAYWALSKKIPLYLGEFGAYGKADMNSRVAWTATVRSEAERLGMDWAYWELASGFGIYDPNTGQWREALRRALIP